MALSQEMRDKLGKAKTTGGGNRYTDGKYLLEVEEMRLKEAGFKGTSVRTRFIVRESEPILPDDFREDDGKVPLPPIKPGVSFDVVFNLTKNDMAYGNIKSEILALFGADEATTSEEEYLTTFDRCVSAGQPTRGMLIRMETFRRRIVNGDNRGKWYVGANWATIPAAEGAPNEPAQVLTRRKASAAAPKPAPATP